MVAYQHIAGGFEPVFNQHSRVLVLGSFPSVLSRKNSFYYGNPANRFWKVVAACVDDAVPADDDIQAKKQLLLRHGIALWDVIQECDIKGSSDASIKNVVPAQVERVFDAANIRAVICNGATAGRLYKRYLQWETNLDAVVLPSTSPANAAWSLERLTGSWSEALRAALAENGEMGAGVPATEGSAGAAVVAAGDGVAAADVGRSAVGSAASAPIGARKAAADGGARKVEYATVRVRAPKASTYVTHRSMQGNKRKDTKPELLVRAALREAGLGGYRLQWKVPGRPDIAWPGKKVCLFINGCFWHRCPHCNLSLPKKNVEYWAAKFDRNVQRDKENLAALQASGWTVHVVWECQLKKNAREATFHELLPQLSEELSKPLAKGWDKGLR